MTLKLIDDIAGRLLRYDMAEYVRLRAACKEWRRCTADPRECCGQLDNSFRPRRWIMLSNRTNGDGRGFLNLTTGASAGVDLPELSSHHLEATVEGLLLLRDKASHAVHIQVIRVEDRAMAFRWQLIQVCEVNLDGKNLLPVDYIGHHRAVFAGEVACFSLSTTGFSCISGNAVYPGVSGYRFPSIGVRYLMNKTIDPPFEFTMDDERLNVAGRELKTFRQSFPDLNLVPLARPCTLPEYLVCCAGLNGGLKD
ncbi:uncharacterized protein LOC112270092 [Brachypodium distachyon]|nr:uncharacterized protein LOC112270092 [Brachypodium distachyon]|eukprot:XP_024313547.1 uncharacterized protein LOC112270092 [Brachypodium distachyon]